MYVLNNKESEKEMKTINLINGTTIRSEKQLAQAFVSVYAEHRSVSADLATIKSAIKENAAYDWFVHGIDVQDRTAERFNKDAAIKLLVKLGATEKQIAGCYKPVASTAITRKA